MVARKNNFCIQYLALAWVVSCPALSCGEAEPQAGMLVVPFALGNYKECADLGITQVRADLDDGAATKAVSCEVGEVRFNDLSPGAYDVKLYGLDADGFPVMDSLGSPARVIVIGEAGGTVSAEPSVVLSSAPASLLLRWDLGFGSCDSTDIDFFMVSAWRQDGSELLLQQSISCDTVGEGEDQYRQLLDENRRLGGSELGEVSIQPFDVNGVSLGDPVLFEFDAPGAGRSVHLTLECEIGGCTGAGIPD